jgi:hypothetical protein
MSRPPRPPSIDDEQEEAPAPQNIGSANEAPAPPPNEDEDEEPRGEIEGGGGIVYISDDHNYYEKGTIVDLEREDDILQRDNNTICNEENERKGKDFRLLFSILL